MRLIFVTCAWLLQPGKQSVDEAYPDSRLAEIDNKTLRSEMAACLASLHNSWHRRSAMAANSKGNAKHHATKEYWGVEV
jgi:hypothetical protein